MLNWRYVKWPLGSKRLNSWYKKYANNQTHPQAITERSANTTMRAQNPHKILKLYLQCVTGARRASTATWGDPRPLRNVRPHTTTTTAQPRNVPEQRRTNCSSSDAVLAGQSQPLRCPDGVHERNIAGAIFDSYSASTLTVSLSDPVLESQQMWNSWSLVRTFGVGIVNTRGGSAVHAICKQLHNTVHSTKQVPTRTAIKMFAQLGKRGFPTPYVLGRMPDEMARTRKHLTLQTASCWLLTAHVLDSGPSFLQATK
jgi:hypothetical protein